MKYEQKSKEGGRPGKGERVLLQFRVPPDLHEIILANAETVEMNISDYCARIAALAHDYPIARLAPAGRTPPADGVHSRFDLAGVLDPDLVSAIAELDEALNLSGLTPGEFAAALGIPKDLLVAYRKAGLAMPVNLHRRARRVSAALHRARANGWMSTFPASLAMRDAVAVADDDWALDLCVRSRDDLREAFAADPEAVGAWEAVPLSCGQIEWDTLLGAIVEHEFLGRNLEPPAWASRSKLSLPKSSWVLPNPSLDEFEVRAQTPPWLASRGVFVSRFDLREP